MAEWQNGGVPFQLPQLAGSIVEEPVSDLNEIDFDLESPEPHSGETLISSQPTTQWPHRLAGGFESFSEGGDTQRTQSFAASSTICPSFLRQTSILRYAFRRTQNPFESEVLQLCNDTGLDKYQVYSWFEGERDLWRNPTANGFITPETTRSGVLPSNLYPDSVFDSNPVQHAGDSSDQVLQTNANAQQRELSIRGPRTRKRPRQAESLHNTASSLIAGDPQKRPRRESGDDSGEKQFSCPSCSSKSKTIDRWRTHQTRKHFPTKLYICRIKTSCKLPSNKLFKTKDSFRNHLRNSHGYEPGKALDEEVSERTFKVTGLFHDECGFCPDKTLGSRGESMEHIMSHIRDGDDVSKWVHKCSSLDHELLPNVHFVPPWDFSEMMNDLFDEDDTDQEDFGGRGAQGGDNDFDDGEGYFEYNSGQGPEGGSSSGCAGEEYPPTSSRGASGSAADRRADMLKLSSHSDEYDAKSNPPGPIQRCTVVRNLGAGGFGTVLEVSLGDPKQTFALKTFRQKHTSPCDVSHYHDFKNEVRMLKALRHPHIIKFVGSYTQAERYSLLLSPVADMDLSRYMRTIEETSSTSLSIRDRSWNLLRGMSSLASALSHIHSSSVWHCDIKPANILVKDDRFILADFGLSRFKPARGIPIKKTTGATRTYAPPEIVNHGVQSSASDVFSLGCVFAELSTLIENKSLSEFEKFRVTKLGDKAFHQTLGETNEWIELLEEEQKRRRCFDQAHSIPFDTIRRMLSESPKDRLTAHEVWLKFPECTCCSDWGSINHQSSSSQDDEESSLASNRDWGGRDKAGQPAGSSIRPSVPARPTSPSHTSRTLFPTADIVSSAARSSPMSDSNPATLGKPQGDTTLGDFSVLHSPQKSSPLVE